MLLSFTLGTVSIIKDQNGCGIFFSLRLKITSCVCLFESGSKLIVHGKAQLITYLNRLRAEVFMLYEMYHQQIAFALEDKPSDKSFIYVYIHIHIYLYMYIYSNNNNIYINNIVII